MFENAAQLYDALEENEQGYRPSWHAIAHRGATAASYHEGVQWRTAAPRGVNPITNRPTLAANYNPDTNDLRVIDNFITPLVNRLSAQTYPRQMEIEVNPGDRDSRADAPVRAQAFEDAASALIDTTGMLESRRDVNFCRTVMGDYGLGLSLEYVTREVEINGAVRPMQDRVLKSFTFPITNLVLDPAQKSRNLADHDWVQYRDVWTVAKAKRVYGEALGDIDPRKCKTVGDLMTFEQQVSNITDGRIFAQAKTHSKSPGVIVWQFHKKDETGRFRFMAVVVDGCYKDAKRWINEDNPETPFGGNGLPLFLYHSHRRTDSMASISDVMMVLDDQNRRNLLATLTMRHAHRYSAFKWRIDKGWCGDNTDDVRNQINNQIGGVLVGKGDRQRGYEPPSIIQSPEPSQVLVQLADREERKAMDKVSRPEVSQGATKSHVPDATFQTAIELADQIGNTRVSEDVETDAEFVKVMLGTATLAAQMGSPGVLATLARRGFTEQDFMVLAESDPYDLGMTVKVRQSSVRNRSHESRRNDLTTALVNQAIDASTFRRGMATLDTPIVEDDKVMEREASKAAARVVRGEPWVAIPLGPDTDTFLSAFRRALVDPRAQRDPQIVEMLKQAIMDQTAMRTQEMFASDPNLQLQQQQQEQQAMAAAAGPAQQAAPEAPVGPASIEEVMARLSGAA